MKMRTRACILPCMLAAVLMLGQPLTVLAEEGGGQGINRRSWVQKEVLDLSGRRQSVGEKEAGHREDHTYLFILSNELDHVLYYTLALSEPNDGSVSMKYRLRSEDGVYLLGMEGEWAEGWELGGVAGRKETLQPGEKRCYYLEWERLENMSEQYQLNLRIEVEMGPEGSHSRADTFDAGEKVNRFIRLWGPVGVNMAPLDLMANLLCALAACVLGIGAWVKYSGPQEKWLPVWIKRKEEKV